MIGTGPQTSISSNSSLQIQQAANVETSLNLWQNGVANAIIGSKPNDTKLYITNDYKQGGLGVDNHSITLDIDGDVGVGTTAPTQKLSVNDGNIAIKALGATGSDEGYNGALIITKPTASGQYINLIRQGQYPWSIGTVYNSNTFAIGYGKSNDADFSSPYFNITSDGKVGIGISNITTDALLTVNGIIQAKEVKISLDGLADYVFDSSYKLMPLHQVESYVNTNNHLPNMPSAAEVSKNGLSMGEMQNKLLQKVEELTLYVIEQQKEINQLKASLNSSKEGK